MSDRKKIVFMTGTRADYGKLIPLIKELRGTTKFELHIFVTGMHMLERFGTTALEVLRENENVYLFNNQSFSSTMDLIVANTIVGFSSYISEIRPDLIVVHGDRAEALAGAIVGSLNNILVAHIEGGEVSGTLDEVIRHAVSKLSHLHLVANEQAASRLQRMGEEENSIAIVGSPDIDVMVGGELPSLSEVRKRYAIGYKKYAIAVLHPVSTELSEHEFYTQQFVSALIVSDGNYIVIDPNNDPGYASILKAYSALDNRENFARFPSIRFTHFLVLLKHADFVIGNSSLGVREAPVYGVPSINIGSRQIGRASAPTILNISADQESIEQAIGDVTKAIVGNGLNVSSHQEFGDGKSVERIVRILTNPNTWSVPFQKRFVD